MHITINNISEDRIKTDVIILPVFEDSLPERYSDLDRLIDGLIRKVIKAKEFTGKQNQLSLLHVQHINAERILLVGLGKQSDISTERIRQAGGRAFSYLQGIGFNDIAVSGVIFKETSEKSQILKNAKNRPMFYFVEGGLLGIYRFEKYKKSENGKEIKTLQILDDDKDIRLKRLQITASAVNFARDLVNTPSNDMTPETLSSIAKSISDKKLKVKILGEKECRREGMGAYLSVSRGSAEPPQFIIIEYKGWKGAPLA
ncbi:MAG: hypothetical protein HY099_01795, partial [Nitrospirae bacterium]|nr:hypothetical protein [Nitrospirota bacterium]